ECEDENVSGQGVQRIAKVRSFTSEGQDWSCTFAGSAPALHTALLVAKRENAIKPFRLPGTNRIRDTIGPAKTIHRSSQRLPIFRRERRAPLHLVNRVARRL